MTTPKTVALLPCPFCGKADLFVEREDFTSSYVMCNDCSARGPAGCQDGPDEETPGKDAAELIWNTRAAPAQCDVRTGDDPSRDELIESIQYAIGTLSMHIEAYHDFDYQPHEVPPELDELRRLQHHLEGSLISSTGEIASTVSSADGGSK